MTKPTDEDPEGDEQQRGQPEGEEQRPLVHEADLALDELDTAIANKDKVGALTALTMATAALNGDVYAAVAPEDGVLAEPNNFNVLYSGWHGVAGIRGVPHWVLVIGEREDDWVARQKERWGRIFKGVEEIVREFGPDQYQISGGFPQLVTVTFTWNVQKTEKKR